MENKLALGSLFLCFHLSISYSSPSQLPIIGIHPLDEKYYDKEVIKCKDGSKTFIRDRLNDNFCDCPDGTDEPGTSACQTGKFYCRNIGSTPRFIFSSRVNDHICDCCDGSDEYDGITTCPNTCIMGGFVYQKVNYDSITNTHGSVNSRKAKLGMDMEDSGQKFGGLLKGLVVFQVALVIIVVAFRLFRRRKTRRRNPR